MTVSDLAKELGVPSKDLVAFLRSAKLPVPTGSAALRAGVASKARARLEKERRATGASFAKIMSEAVLAAGPVPTRRRRKPARRRRVATGQEEATAEAVVAGVEEGSEAAADPSGTEGDGEVRPTRRRRIAAVEAGPDGEIAAGAAGLGLDEVAAVADAEALESVPLTFPDGDAVYVDGAFPVETAAESSTAPAASPDGDLAARPEIRPDLDDRPTLPDVSAPAPLQQPGVGPLVPPGSGGLRPAAAGSRSNVPSPAATAGPRGQVRIQASGFTSDGRRKRRGGGRGGGRGRGSNQAEARRNVARIRGQMRGPGRRPRRRRVRLTREELEAQVLQEAAEQERKERERKTVRVAEFLSVAELAEMIDESATELVGSAFGNLGLHVTINQRLDFDQIEMLLDEFNFTVVREETADVKETVDPYGIDSETAEPRPPVVTVMGHVDHGKTLLLDRIRKSNVVAGEAGGITQHIGAYHVALPNGRVTFLDTPGHAAFTAMRARGAEVTDIVILLVAADDSVMPQTVEAINHALSAGVPIVVAVNKCDLPGVDPSKVLRELLRHSVQVDELGGDVLSAKISAKTGDGVDELLEQLLLQAELMEDGLKADPLRHATGTVVEARLDIGKGPVATVLVQGGTLRVGDTFVCGLHQGRVRAMHDERGRPVKEAGPSMPVQVLGAGGMPQAGDSLQVMDPSRAQAAVAERQQLDREKQMRLRERAQKVGDFGQLQTDGGVIELPILVKGDVDGSVQALSDALEQLGGKEDGVRVRIVHRGVGAINESDVLLARTTDAVIIGFGVRPQSAARRQAEQAAVEIRTYDIIYQAVDDLAAALEGRLAPDQVEQIEGSAQVREVFRISRVGTIAGCYVVQGRMHRNARARVLRDGRVVYDGEVGSLKRFKDDVREVREGFECGIGIANFNDVKTGDEIECYTVEEIARKLAKAG